MYRINNETFMPTGPNRFAILSEDYVPSADVKTEKKVEKKTKKTKKKSVVVLADKL
jgi:hypothetical protein